MSTSPFHFTKTGPSAYEVSDKSGAYLGRVDRVSPDHVKLNPRWRAIDLDGSHLGSHYGSRARAVEVLAEAAAERVEAMDDRTGHGPTGEEYDLIHPTEGGELDGDLVDELAADALSAFLAGSPDAPALSAVVMREIDGRPVGEERTQEVMRTWRAAYDQARIDAAEEVEELTASAYPADRNELDASAYGTDRDRRPSDDNPLARYGDPFVRKAAEARRPSIRVRSWLVQAAQAVAAEAWKPQTEQEAKDAHAAFHLRSGLPRPSVLCTRCTPQTEIEPGVGLVADEDPEPAGPVPGSFHDPRVSCCGRDVADCDCPAVFAVIDTDGSVSDRYTTREAAQAALPRHPAGHTVEEVPEPTACEWCEDRPAVRNGLCADPACRGIGAPRTCERCGEEFDAEQAGTSDDPPLCTACTSYNDERVAL